MKKAGRFKKNNWVSSGELSTPRMFLAKKLSRFAVLQAAWSKETGKMANYWSITAVRGGTIFIEVKSSSAAQELDLRRSVLIKSLNKHFARNWIREIKQS